MVDWRGELTEQLDWYWTQMFRPRLEGLTDAEYLWEPVEGCWSVRPAGDGRFTVDWADPEPSPPPFTTIAWRLAHIGSGVLGLRANTHFGDGTLTLERIVWPGTAADAIAFVEDAYAAWKAGVDGLAETALARPIGPTAGPWADYPFASLVLHINREVIHHGAEVALLRDLYRDRRGVPVRAGTT
jgi:hypothetical protein